MSKGKAISQACHASIEAYLRTIKKHPEWATLWLAEGMKKIVLKANSKEELTHLFHEVKNLMPAALITDAGHTQVEPGTLTALGVGPAPEIEIDKFFSKYKLL